MDITKMAKKKAEEIGITDEIPLNYFVMGYTQGAFDAKVAEIDDLIEKLGLKKRTIPHETR